MTEAAAETIYLSAVTGHLVPRFGTLGCAGGKTFIGARRDAKTGKMVVNEDAIVFLSEAEFGKHRKEYNRAIDDGALKRRTREEYQTWTKQVADQVAAEAKAHAEAQAAKQNEQTDDAQKPDDAPADAAPIVDIEGDAPEPDGVEE